MPTGVSIWSMPFRSSLTWIFESQGTWLDECRRVLRPGGAFIFTVHGSAFRDRLSEKERDEFDSGRPVVRRGQYTGANLCACFHPESHVRQTMASGFEGRRGCSSRREGQRGPGSVYAATNLRTTGIRPLAAPFDCCLISRRSRGGGRASRGRSIKPIKDAWLIQIDITNACHLRCAHCTPRRSSHKTSVFCRLRVRREGPAIIGRLAARRRMHGR